jgi:signal transduction histidine kinase
MTEEISEEAATRAVRPSADRRPPVEPSTVPSRAIALRRAQVRAVGAAFLRVRPFVVAPVALANAALLASADAPALQRASLGGAIGAALAVFSVEAWLLRRRVVGERWLFASLALTLVALASGCALSGGGTSPLVPLLAAPLAVGVAAFGRTARTLALLAVALGAFAGVAALPAGVPFPPVPADVARFMALASFAAMLALVWAGVGGLVEAHQRTADVLDRMRAATLEEAASRMRHTEQVGAKVAHELKNPLAAIRALLQLLGRNEADERTRKRLDVALAEADRMDAIVGDYLSFARPLSELDPHPVDLTELARDVVAVLEARAEASGVRIEARGEPAPMVADPRRLREALLNLAANAVAATPRGGHVALRVDGGEREVRVIVEDTGAGMPEAIAVGTPFVTTKEGGTGLGIVLARAAVAQHGGTLAFAPRPGGGTIATATLPRATDDAGSR